MILWALALVVSPLFSPFLMLAGLLRIKDDPKDGFLTILGSPLMCIGCVLMAGPAALAIGPVMLYHAVKELFKK